MTLRDIQLPADLIPLGELITQSFQYPENEAWSVQTDEQEQLVESVNNLSRIWPLIKFAGLFATSVRDLLRGCVWEEDGKLVGAAIVQRHGSTDTWIVGTVAVLPDYRRRGLARKLVERGLEIIRQEGGKRVWLSVIDGNVPAYSLYERLGFEHYSGQIEFQASSEEIPAMPVLPEGYEQSTLKKFDWRPKFELDKRISPENLLKYEPVVEGRYRQPLVMRLIYPLIMLAQGMREDGVWIRSAEDGRVIARGEYSVPRRKIGFNALWVRLDPERVELASYLVGFLLYQVSTLSPGRRIEMSVPLWMEPLIAAAEQAGFERRMTYHRMGILLDN